MKIDSICFQLIYYIHCQKKKQFLYKKSSSRHFSIFTPKTIYIRFYFLNFDHFFSIYKYISISLYIKLKFFFVAIINWRLRTVFSIHPYQFHFISPFYTEYSLIIEVENFLDRYNQRKFSSVPDLCEQNVPR